MRIRVDASGSESANDALDVLWLTPSGWNDFWKYSTVHSATYVDASGTHHSLGGVKIGEFGLAPADKLKGEAPARPTVPDNVPSLPDSLFSVGTDSTYYERVANLGDGPREAILRALQDVAFNPDLLASARNEYVFTESLLRDVSEFELSRQWARIASGGAPLTRYDFTFHAPAFMSRSGLALAFEVTPYELPHSNIHVIIGRNGVGKSTLLRYMAQSLVPENQDSVDVGSFSFGDATFDGFANVVSLSYSVFDRYDPVDLDRLRDAGYSHIGHDEFVSENSPGALTSAAESCSRAPKKQRLINALRLLENDPIFEEQGLSGLLENSPAELFQTMLPSVYAELSSGHKIVLSSIMRLVEAVEEKTLVLIDEPETHLHPPLLSAYIRALSELLTNRNGVAVIATHSPVVLQEVPQECVWRLARYGDESQVGRLETETYGENVGLLTNEVFGLEVTDTGYHATLTRLARDAATYEDALFSLNGHLGAEGRSILRSRILRKLAASAKDGNTDAADEI